MFCMYSLHSSNSTSAAMLFVGLGYQDLCAVSTCLTQSDVSFVRHYLQCDRFRASLHASLANFSTSASEYVRVESIIEF
jgi:hypothetical protein